MKKKNIAEQLILGTRQDVSVVPMVECFENVFSKLNEKFFDGKLPKAVITIQADFTGKAYGWCSGLPVWHDKDGGGYFEINISADHLFRPYDEIIGTLLHEMVHLENAMNGVKDTSRAGTYHNEKYKNLAVIRGLNCEKGEKYGWHKTSLNDDAKAFVETLDLTDFEIQRDAWKAKAVKKKAKQAVIKYECPCCGNSVRATKNVNIGCLDCGEPMLANK